MLIRIGCAVLLISMAACSTEPSTPPAEPTDATSETMPETAAQAEQAEQVDEVDETGSRHYSLQSPDMPGTAEGNVHIYFASRQPDADEQPFLVVWTDASSYSGATGFPSPGNIPANTYLVDGEYELQYIDEGEESERIVPFSFEIQDEAQGQLTIDEDIFDFERGAVFLIAGSVGEIRIRQLIRDPSDLPMNRESAIRVGESDPDIAAFFSDGETSEVGGGRVQDVEP